MEVYVVHGWAVSKIDLLKFTAAFSPLASVNKVIVYQGSPVKDQLPQLPASSYVESVVVALERHPLGSILLILLVGVVAFGVYAWKH